MIVFDAGAGEPGQWAICFTRKCATRWLQWLPVGKYKHVRAFGCVPHIHTWVFFDPALSRTAIKLARGQEATALIAEYLHDADVIQMPHMERKSLRPQFFGWCVPAVAHLVGIPSSALRPDRFWADCLRHGGTILQPAAD